MTTPDWQQVKSIFNVAVDLSSGERPAYLQEACQGDQALKREVESLLASHEQTEGFLESTAVAEAASLLERDLSKRWIGRRLGPYELLEELGRGGMGQVFRARRADGQYESEVAVKLVPAAFASPALQRRFAAERQILARLVHPGIARLLDGGTTSDNVPYLVMELVDGQPIDAYCKANKLPLELRLRLFVSVCEAVSYAHRHLVVHRDLKPNNIFVTTEGTAKLLDFGVAKVLDSMTPPGQPPTVTLLRAFTLTFASPEQIRGEPVTTASDVYSLGVLLYHLLIGASPYRTAEGPLSALSHEICEKPPLPPSAAATRRANGAGGDVSSTRIGSDLDSIALLALQKDPARRYASVDLLAADVRRHLEHRPVVAHGNAPAYRIGKFMRRNRLATVISIAAVLLALMGVVLVAHNERSAAAQATQRLAGAHRAARFLLQQLEQRAGSAAARMDAAYEDQAVTRLEGIAGRAHDEEALYRELETIIPAPAPAPVSAVTSSSPAR